MLFVVGVAVPVGVWHIVHLIDRRKAFGVKDILNMLSRKTRPKICVQNDILFVLPLSMSMSMWSSRGGGRRGTCEN